MTKLHEGALFCGLVLAVLLGLQPVSAYAETAVPPDPASAAAAPQTVPAATSSASPTASAAGQPTAPAEAEGTTTPTPSSGASASPEVPANTPADPTAEPPATAEPTASTTPEPGAPVGLPATPTAATSTYIVGFRKDVAQAPAVLGERKASTVSGLDAVVTTLTAAEARTVADDASVAYVQKDTRVHLAATQTDPTWGVDRIDQAALPLDDSYTANQTGAGVTVYLIDTGIDAGNPEFAGRVGNGASFVPDRWGTADCHGHGTHVAGIVGGTTYGVAKKVTLVPVRVLDCQGEGYSSWTVAGLNWVLKQHHRGQPAVVNLSLVGAYDKAENDAVKRLTAEGVTVVAAAGNDGANACGLSPASAKSALTVAASDRTDGRWADSNYGPCVDLYAPGVLIPSASAFGADPVVMTGTSMASPHVAGVAALVLGAHHSWSATKVSERVLALSHSGVVSGNRSGTPNRLLNIAPTVRSVGPGFGSQAGGQRITITGTNFHGVRQVLIGGVPATKVDAVSDSTIRVTTPAHRTTGTVPVRVVTELSDSNTTVSFEYRPAPTMTALSATAGSTRGGTLITITGTHLSGATSVQFGNRKGRSLTPISASMLQVVAPSHSGGTVSVRVTTPAGTTAKVTAGRFAYGHVPKVKKLSTRQGLSIGGTRLKIAGKYLRGVTSVSFGGVAGTDLRVTSSKRLYVTVPAHAVGRVEVRLANHFGASTTTSKARYTFRVAPAPRVTKVTPASGHGVGGAAVTITGKNFYGVTSVTFGTQRALVTSTSPTKLVVTAPQNTAGDSCVRVTGAYGTSPESGPTFRYVETRIPELP